MLMFPTPPVLVPDPVITENIVYYDVQGNSAKELVASLNTKGNAATNGAYWGATRISYSWGYDTRTVDRHCELVKPYVSATITRVYPHWVAPQDASTALVTQWKAMLAALTHHEDEHANLIRRAIQDVVLLMRQNGTATRCTELSVDLYEAGLKTFRVASERSFELDERTRHGSLEGVNLRW